MDLVRLCFSFYGRVNRAKYWIGFGIAYGMMVLAMTLWFAVPENDQVATGVGLWIIVWNVSLFALATKRLHDLGISGWWLLGFLIVFAVLVGTRQDVLASIGSVLPYSLASFGWVAQRGRKEEIAMDLHQFLDPLNAWLFASQSKNPQPSFLS
jgi:uncharacterized membrane protein YhaH (DUF805 family)